MNKERRKRLEKLIDQLGGFKTAIEILRDEEQDAFENLPESLQGAERGMKMEEAIEALEEVIDSLDEVESSLLEVAQ